MCACVHAQSLQSCPTLCDPKNCSLPGSSVYGILQARILEWVAMLSSRGTSKPDDQNLICLHLLHCRWIPYPLGSPMGSPICWFSHKQISLIGSLLHYIKISTFHYFYHFYTFWVRDFFCLIMLSDTVYDRIWINLIRIYIN